MKKFNNSQIKNITKFANTNKLFFFLAISTGLAILLISGIKIYAIKVSPYTINIDPCEKPIKSTQINKLADEIRTEIGQKKFNLELANPCEGSICITTNGYLDGKELENLTTEHKDFYTKPIKTGLITKFPDFLHFAREVFIRFYQGRHERDGKIVVGDINERDDDEIIDRGEEAVNRLYSSEKLKNDYSIFLNEQFFEDIRKFSLKCIKKFSTQKDEIVFTGFGSSAAEKEFQIIFSTISKNSDIKISDIHLIDTVYKDIINYFSSDSTNNFELFTTKEVEAGKEGFLTVKNFKKIINYTHLLNKKTNTNNPIRLFLHKDTKSYLNCISKFRLSKANILTAFYAAGPELINIIINGTQENCLFLLVHKTIISTYLNKEERMEAISKIIKNKLELSFTDQLTKIPVLN